jgi:excisionase family DNA binding protein
MAARLRSVGEAAEELNVSKDLLRRLIKKGLVRAVRISKRLLIAQVEIDRLVANGLEEASAGKPAPARAYRSSPLRIDPLSPTKGKVKY